MITVSKFSALACQSLSLNFCPWQNLKCRENTCSQNHNKHKRLTDHTNVFDLDLLTGSSCNFSNIPWAGNTRKNISMQTVKDSRWQFIPCERTRALRHNNWRAVAFRIGATSKKRFIFCLIWLPSSRIFVTGWVTHNKLVPQCCYTRRFFRRTNIHTYKPLNGNQKRICTVLKCEVNNPGNIHPIPFYISIFSTPLKDIEGCSSHLRTNTWDL